VLCAIVRCGVRFRLAGLHDIACAAFASARVWEGTWIVLLTAAAMASVSVASAVECIYIVPRWEAWEVMVGTVARIDRGPA
jgi:hypothetical protein